MTTRTRRTAGPTTASAAAPLPTALLLAISFVAGFAMMLVEVTATRLLAPHFGTSVFTWTNVIGAIMIALAGGYYLGGRLADRDVAPGYAFALLAVAGVLTAAVPLAATQLGTSLAPDPSSFLSSVPVLLRASLFVTVVVFVPPVFCMSLLSPLVVKLLARDHHVGWASGANSAAGTAGALLGTFAPTVWLVPAWGSRRTVLAAAGLQLLLAAAGFALVRHRRGAAAGLALLVAVGGGAWWSGGPMRAVPGLLEERETRYQYASVVRDGPSVELLLEGQRTGAQSVLRDGRLLTGGLYHDYQLLLPFVAGRSPGSELKVLIVGLAAGTSAHQYQHFFGPLHRLAVDGVEIDGEVVDLARRHFGLGAGEARGLRVHVADGRTFVASSAERYDVVLLDVAANQFFLPFHLATREFFEQVRDRLAPGGVVGMNVILHGVPSRLGAALEATFHDVFGAVARLRIPNSYNVQLIARHGAPIDLEATRSRIAAYPGAGVAPVSEAADLRALLGPAVADLAFVRPDPATPPLTDDHAPVEHLSRADMLAGWERR